MNTFRKMMVESVRIHIPTNQHVVLLKEVEGERYLPIWIGETEANAIAITISGSTAPRPLTYDLFAQILTEADTEVRRIEIASLVDEVFYARLHLFHDGRDIDLDARPSDAIALAVRVHADIYAAEKVLEEAGVFPESETEGPDNEENEAQGKADIPEWLRNVDLKLPDLGQNDDQNQVD